MTAFESSHHPMLRLLVFILLSLAVDCTNVRADEAKPDTPARTEAAPENKIVMGVVPGVMQYDKKTFSVKAGEKVALLFINKGCPLQHNLIILKPGTEAAYGAAADKMITNDPTGAMAKHYLPDDATSVASVIAATTKPIGAGQNEILRFTAPTTTGDYPYICTFPGHRFLMKGVMTVTK